MTWITTHKPSFLSDLIELPKDLQKSVVGATADMEADPITPRGNTIKKLQGYNNVYRYRLGDFRLIYAADLKAQMINLLSIGPRGSVYQRFNYAGWNAPDAAADFNPELADRVDWQDHPEWLAPKGSPDRDETLPRALTAELLARWRVDPAHHAALIACRTADELLGAGCPGSVIERVMNGLYEPSAADLANEPDLMLFNSEDLIRYAEGDLAGFLLRLDEQQEPLTRWALRGPTLVKGGPGSGKSTVALYRVRALIEYHKREHDRIPTVLFTTYTNALINASKSLLQQLLGDTIKLTKAGELPNEIRVSTLDKTAQWIARTSGRPFQMASAAQFEDALRTARAGITPRSFGQADLIAVHGQVKDLDDNYLRDEFAWVIEGQNCQTLDDYLRADRTGRGVAFTKERRAAVWRLYEAFREHLTGQGLLTWGQVTQLALEQVRSGEFARRWDYVVVDEAQDLPPAGMALAVELCSDPSGVFLTADANQSLYNRGFRWRSVHESLSVSGRTRVLRRNYRTTRAIAAAAAEIVAGLDDTDAEAAEQEYIHTGPRPARYAASSSTDEWRYIARWIVREARRLRLPAGAAAVLVPSSEVGRPLADALVDHGLPAKFMPSRDFDLDEPGVKVTTLHAAKGLEFPIVVVAHVEAGRLPRETSTADPEERAAFEANQQRLFYVGCTRAMRQLLITYDRGLPSPFLADLSGERWSWTA